MTSQHKSDRERLALPRYWVREEVADERLPSSWGSSWLAGWRDICRSTDERTVISTILGEGARPEGGLLLCFPAQALRAPLLVVLWNSFVVDYVARQKVGGTHLKYFTMKQLPVLEPAVLELPVPWSKEDSLEEWLGTRCLLLVDTAKDLARFADEVQWMSSSDLGIGGRRVVRAELDAACFHLYGVDRDDVDYIMETFPIVKRKDVAEFGEYRTKRMILEAYDAMAKAAATGVRYASPFGSGDEVDIDA